MPLCHSMSPTCETGVDLQRRVPVNRLTQLAGGMMGCRTHDITYAASLAIYVEEEGRKAMLSADWVDVVIVPASLTSALASHAGQERGFRRAVHHPWQTARKQ